MTEHDILSDAEREALNEVMRIKGPIGYRVLIVDDDEISSELLAEYLAQHGIACLTAINEAQALELLATDNLIGLLLTDLQMQPHDGLHLIREVRGSPRAELPIIIMSGRAGVRDAIEAMHLSVIDFLLKPIDPEKLLGLIRHELDL